MKECCDGPYFCQLDDCDREVPFDRLTDLRHHLNKVHGVKKEVPQNCYLANWGYITIKKDEKTRLKKVVALL
ncbi:MAG: hypothetical protein V5A88_10150 [Candidatus Thermoplasmatota archaeon]